MKRKSSTTMLLPVIAIFFFTVNSWAQDNLHDTASEYLTSSTMNCGAINVHVTTYCELGEKLNPDCFLQKVVFTNLVTQKYSRKFYLYENYKKDMSLIVDMVCVKKGAETGIVLASTNLGNCEVCEWEDFFDDAGILLGSSRYKFGATNFKAQPISEVFYKKYGYVIDERGRFVELKRVPVARSNRTK